MYAPSFQGVNASNSGSDVLIGNPQTLSEHNTASRIESYLTARGHRSKTEFAASRAGALEASIYLRNIIDMIAGDQNLPGSTREAYVKYLANASISAKRVAARLF